MNDPIVFSAEWFERHQGKLLWLLNHWLTRRWFRWVLRIRKCDIGYAQPIVGLFPHAYTVALGENEFATDFRTHNKYAKRLYYAFKPLWFALHLWDWLAADQWAPRLSFGFGTLTLFPDAGTGATTVDGYVARTAVNETFATIRGGAGTNSSAVGGIDVIELDASSTLNQFAFLYRLILTFNTTFTVDVDVVQSAVLSCFGNDKNNGLGSPDLHVAGSTPASNNALVNADFSQVQTVTFGSIVYASFSILAYNAVTLNASGLANITLNGISKFSAQLSWDLNNSFTGAWVSTAFSNVAVVMADTAGTTTDPKLVVTYNTKNRFTNQTNALRPRFFRPGMAR